MLDSRGSLGSDLLGLLLHEDQGLLPTAHQLQEVRQVPPEHYLEVSPDRNSPSPTCGQDPHPLPHWEQGCLSQYVLNPLTLSLSKIHYLLDAIT